MATAAAALAQPDQPDPIYRAIAAILQRQVGHKVMTLLRFDGTGLISRRLFSTLSTYPAGAIKGHVKSPWYEAVYLRGEPFLAA
ncbi:MAG: hypothetical protein FJX52_16755, partial [Alphaproteobacteria bacterium]|nr:hypothetical protein [Alphaproteobacteria bacterium]